jgi:hypothetical protein
MFVIYTTHVSQEDQQLFPNLVTLHRNCEVLPEAAEKLAEGVWFLQDVESLSFLSTLGMLSQRLNLGLEFHVKGLAPS